MAEIIEIRTEVIETGDRHRTLDGAACDRLAASMKEIGLRQPITVRVVDMMVIDGQEVEGVPVLVAGRHRLEAAKRLGWSHIDCIEVDDDQLRAELWEIAENLHRHDLTKEQRDQHIRRYAEVLEAIEVERQSRQTVAIESKREDRKGHRPEGVASKIAKETGLSKRTVERALNPKPAAEIIPIAARSEQDAVQAQANAIVSAWNRASPEARAIAMEQIESPVFDRTRAAG